MLNLLKLCVGAESVEDLAGWQASQAPRWPEGRAVHVTRLWPKREAELLDGGSLYWVIKGVVLARQRLVALEQAEEGRCALILDAAIIRTEPQARAPFQGWRYLSPDVAPRDLAGGGVREDRLPPALAAALAAMGVR